MDDEEKIGNEESDVEEACLLPHSPINMDRRPMAIKSPKVRCSSLCLVAGCALAVSLSAVSTTVCGAEGPSLGSGGQRCAETDLLLDP